MDMSSGIFAIPTDRDARILVCVAYDGVHG